MQIWKFEIPMDNFIVEMPKDATLLSVDVNGRSIVVWAIVNPMAPKVTRRLPIFGTGHEIQGQQHKFPFIGTVFMGPLVFHVFDGGEGREF